MLGLAELVLLMLLLGCTTPRPVEVDVPVEARHYIV